MTALHNIRSRLFSEVQYLNNEQFCVLDNSVSTSENIRSNMYSVWLVNPKINYPKLRVEVLFLSYLMKHDIRFFLFLRNFCMKNGDLKIMYILRWQMNFELFMRWNKTLFHIIDNDYCLQGMNSVSEHFVENSHNICSII